MQKRKESKVRKRTKSGLGFLERKLSNSSLNREVQLLKQVCRLGCRYGYLQTNPAADAERLPEPRNWTILNDEEARALIEAARPSIKPILRLLLTTGMRKNEALRLVWAFPGYERKIYADDGEARSVLDMKRGLIHIPGQLAKNHKAREIPLSLGLLEMFGTMAKTPLPAAAVFAVSTIARAFRSARSKAGIQKLRVHDIRHSAASRMIEAGISVVDVCELLGHSDLKTTMSYCHPSIDNKKRAVQTLCDIYEKSRKKVDTSISAPTATSPVIPLKSYN